MIVVLDTNVLVAGFRSNRGASFRILNLLPDGIFTPLISVPLFLEYEAVLKRPDQLKASGLVADDIDAVLDMMANVAQKVRLYYLWRPLLSDPADDMVAETAITGGAEAIVTFNARHFRWPTGLFATKIIDPATFVGLIEDTN